MTARKVDAEWARLATDFFQDPAIVKAGSRHPEAEIVFIRLICAARKLVRKHNGSVPLATFAAHYAGGVREPLEALAALADVTDAPITIDLATDMISLRSYSKWQQTAGDLGAPDTPEAQAAAAEERRRKERERKARYRAAQKHDAALQAEGFPTDADKPKDPAGDPVAATARELHEKHWRPHAKGQQEDVVTRNNIKTALKKGATQEDLAAVLPDLAASGKVLSHLTLHNAMENRARRTGGDFAPIADDKIAKLARRVPAPRGQLAADKAAAVDWSTWKERNMAS